MSRLNVSLHPGKIIWSLPWKLLGAGLTGILTGAVIAQLPLTWVIIALVATILIVATFINPLVGLFAALILGPTKPLTDYFVPQLPLDLGQIVLIITLGAWLLHGITRRKLTIPRTPLNIPLILFFAAILLSLVNALSLNYALKELIKWIQLLVVMWVVIDQLKGEHQNRLWLVFMAIVASGLFQAFIGIWQFGLRGDGPEHFLILNERFYRAYGSFEQPNPYGGFLGLILPLAISMLFNALWAWLKSIEPRFKRPSTSYLQSLVAMPLTKNLLGVAIWGGISGLLGAALLMSWSRGAWLGAGAAAIVVIFAAPKKTRAGIGVVLVATILLLGIMQLGLLPSSIAQRLTGFTEFVQTFDVRGVDITPDNYAVVERLAHWQAAQDMARENFWFGVGAGNYEPVYPAYAMLNWPYPLGHAHNYYLNLLAETGIIGLLTYGLLWISIFWQTWRLTKQAAPPVRTIAIGLMGTWTHLAIHQLVDKLYVANLHLHIGVLLGLLSVGIYISEINSVDKKSREPDHSTQGIRSPAKY